MELNHYCNYAIAQQQELQDTKKANELKERVRPFAEIETLEDAHQLAKKVIPTQWPYMSFYVGNAKCSVINKPDSFRISIETADEFICYDFS